MIVGSISLQERNFLGKGYNVKVNTSAQLVKRQNVDFSFTNPYFMGLPISAGFDVFATNVDNQDESNYNSQQLGFALRTGFRLDEYSGLTFKYGLTWRDIDGINKNRCVARRHRDRGRVRSSPSSAATYTWDNLDNPMPPDQRLPRPARG